MGGRGALRRLALVVISLGIGWSGCEVARSQTPPTPRQDFSSLWSRWGGTYLDAQMLWFESLSTPGQPDDWVRDANRQLRIAFTPGFDALWTNMGVQVGLRAVAERAANYLATQLNLTVRFVPYVGTAEQWTFSVAGPARTVTDQPNIVIGLRSELPGAARARYRVVAGTSDAVTLHNLNLPGGSYTTQRGALIFFNEEPALIAFMLGATRDIANDPRLRDFPGRSEFVDHSAALCAYFMALHELMHALGLLHPIALAANVPAHTVPVGTTGPVSVMGVVAQVSGADGSAATRTVAGDMLTYLLGFVAVHQRFPREADIALTDAEIAAARRILNPPPTTPVPPVVPSLELADTAGGARFCMAPGGGSRVKRSTDNTQPGDLGACGDNGQSVTVRTVTLANSGANVCLQPKTPGALFPSEDSPVVRECTGWSRADDQTFVLISYPNARNWLQIRSLATGLCLDGSATPVNEGLVWFEDCAARSEQSIGQAFVYARNTDGSVTLTSAANRGLALNLEAGAAEAVRRLVLSDRTTVATGRWSLRQALPVSPAILRGLHTLRNVARNACLQIDPNSGPQEGSGGGAGMRFSDCPRSASQASGPQSWMLDQGRLLQSDVLADTGGLFQLRGVDGQCLVAREGGDPTTGVTPGVVTEEPCAEKLVSQRWLLQRQLSGSVLIQSLDRGWVLQARDSADGNVVVLSTPQKAASAQWTLEEIQRAQYMAGLYTFTVQHSQLQLAARLEEGSSPTLEQWHETRDGNALWQVIPRSDGQQELHAFEGGGCITAAGGDAGVLQLQACELPQNTLRKGQRFYLPGRDETGPIQPVLGGAVMQVSPSSLKTRAPVSLGSDDGKKAQRWNALAFDTPQLIRSGLFWVRPANSELCLDLPDGITAPGVGLVLDKCAVRPTVGQIWRFRADLTMKYYNLTPAAATDLCASVAESRRIELGAQITLEKCVPGMSLQWWKGLDIVQAMSFESGVVLVNLGSGQPLFANMTTTPVARAEQYPWQGREATANWKWILAPLPPTVWTDFVDAPGYTLAVRYNPEAGEVECASVDGINCSWGHSAAEVSTMSLKPLQCGAMHVGPHGTDGYSDPKHWCRRFLLAYQSKEFFH